MDKIPRELIIKITDYAICKNTYYTKKENVDTGTDYFIMYLLFRLYNSELKRYRNIIKLTNKLKNTMYYN